MCTLHCRVNRYKITVPQSTKRLHVLSLARAGLTNHYQTFYKDHTNKLSSNIARKVYIIYIYICAHTNCNYAIEFEKTHMFEHRKIR